MDRAENTAPPRPGERVTVAEVADRLQVAVHVAQGARQLSVSGWVYAWTPTSVLVAWKDSQGLQHRDWFDAADVQRSSEGRARAAGSSGRL